MSSENRPRHSIVIPVYRNEDTLGALVERIDELAARLDGSLEAVFVVDGSPDGSLALLRGKIVCVPLLFLLPPRDLLL